jgi:deferrochelatase/peroxidase EfeB
VVPVDAHIRLAAPAKNDGVRLLRRGYSFTDGIDPVTNQLDAGLFFIAYQRDPRTGFIPVQQQLRTDALNEYIRHNGTATFAVPPGVDEGGYIGETLFS